MRQIPVYFQASDRIATSGQPSFQQFADIAAAGYSVVINLALTTSTHAISNEREIVEALGMLYVPIPVSWETPQLADVQEFFAAMAKFAGKKIWVHCALNMRASCFIYLYKKCVLKMAEAHALFPMSAIWQPTGAWENLITAAVAQYAPQPLS